MLDYEVPLKATRAAKHGDIDLLAKNVDRLFVIEAKHPDAAESPLKAILEAYTYTRLIYTVKKAFYSNYGLFGELPLSPTVLVFASSMPGRQLAEISKYPSLLSLVHKFDDSLSAEGIDAIRYYLITNDADELLDYLVLPNIIELNGV